MWWLFDVFVVWWVVCFVGVVFVFVVVGWFLFVVYLYVDIVCIRGGCDVGWLGVVVWCWCENYIVFVCLWYWYDFWVVVLVGVFVECVGMFCVGWVGVGCGVGFGLW